MVIWTPSCAFGRRALSGTASPGASVRRPTGKVATRRCFSRWPARVEASTGAPASGGEGGVEEDGDEGREPDRHRAAQRERDEDEGARGPGRGGLGAEGEAARHRPM